MKFACDPRKLRQWLADVEKFYHSSLLGGLGPNIPVQTTRSDTMHTLPIQSVEVNTSKGSASIPLRGESQIKWGSVTKILPDKPRTWREAVGQLLLCDRAPQAHDVLIGQVIEMGRHTGIELENGRKSNLYLGDLVALAFGNRYATNQYEGEVPGYQPTYHMLSQGGVCGRVVSAAYNMEEPTVIRPLGYLADDCQRVVNLRNYAPQVGPAVARPTIIIAVGSSMDAGKTTMASSIIHGLVQSGNRVNAGKLTGTACVKDLLSMSDAGATQVMDFNHVGFASTFKSSHEELHAICDTMISSLSQSSPDYLVLEIADGIIQKETQSVISYLQECNLCDHFCLAVHDALAAPACVDILRRGWGIVPALLSGMVTISPLSTAEAAGLVSMPCVTRDELASGDVERFFCSAFASSHLDSRFVTGFSQAHVG